MYNSTTFPLARHSSEMKTPFSRFSVNSLLDVTQISIGHNEGLHHHPEDSTDRISSAGEGTHAHTLRL